MPSPRFPLTLATSAAFAAALAYPGVARSDPPAPLQGAGAVEPPAPLQVATPVEPPAPPRPPPPPPPPVAQVATEPRPERMPFANVKFDAGVAVIPGRTPGAFARLGLEALWVRDARRPSFMYGMWGAWEAWGVSRATGGGYPMVFFVGVKSPRLVASVGGGLNVFSVSDVDKKRGGGVLSPRASVRFGMNLDRVHLGAIADVHRAWEWGHPDQTIFHAGVTLGILVEKERAKTTF